jgi:UDPglucose 6-dehydrogenase
LSFVNAVAVICERVGADIEDVVVGMGYDRRIGTAFMRPGPGWGGSCFPKDTRALLRIAQDAGYDFDLLAGAVAANEAQLDHVAAKILGATDRPPSEATIAVWGLTFKARTDDLRDSPSLAVVARLLAAGATVRAYDPTVTAARAPIPAGVTVATDALDACAGADVLAVLTEWDDFRWLDPADVAQAMARRAVVDGRNLLERARWVRAGFDYRGIGRG